MNHSNGMNTAAAVDLIEVENKKANPEILQIGLRMIR